MRAIEVSAEVWAEIAKAGKFGEREDDVLRRILGLPPSGESSSAPGRAPPPSRRTFSASLGRRQRVATSRMSAFVKDSTLVVDFHGGPQKAYALPERTDKAAIRRVRDAAVRFANGAGATYGQEMAVKKALTEAGYHLIK